MVILSRNNPTVKELASLKEKKGRKERGTFLIEGEKMVREAIGQGVKILRLIAKEGYEVCYDYPVVTLGEDAMRAVCDEKTPQPLAAEAQIPRYPLQKPSAPCLFLDGVSDPGNMGAIIRSANAAGFGEIYLADCVDPFSPKSVRASMSGVFSVRLYQGSREEILNVLSGVPVLAADMKGENLFTFTPPELYCLTIGNEGKGLSEEVRRAATEFIRIPMEEHTESLNAAVSASIAMYLLKKDYFLKK